MDPIIFFYAAMTLVGIVGIIYGLTHRQPRHR